MLQKSVACPGSQSLRATSPSDSGWPDSEPPPPLHAFMWNWPEEGEGKVHGNMGQALTTEL